MSTVRDKIMQSLISDATDIMISVNNFSENMDALKKKDMGEILLWKLNIIKIYNNKMFCQAKKNEPLLQCKRGT